MSRGLPKLYRTVTLRFWSLRDRLGPSLGVIPDCDTQITRKAMRVIGADGTWEWSLRISYFPYTMFVWDDPKFLTDQECINEGDRADVEILKHNEGN